MIVLSALVDEVGPDCQIRVRTLDSLSPEAKKFFIEELTNILVNEYEKAEREIQRRAASRAAGGDCQPAAPDPNAG